MENANNNTVKNWDNLTKILLGVAALLILFSFVAPYLFTRGANYESLDFSGKGEIGDVIGGIMNPFIALVGVLLTFLAFYMQIKANELQRKLFLDGIKYQKEVDYKKIKDDHNTRLRIIKALFESIIFKLNRNGEFLKDFIEKEKQYPLKPNIFSGTTNTSYQNFLNLDILETYKSMVFYFQEREVDWEKKFIQTLDALDFYEKLSIELRDKYKIHIDKKFTVISQAGKDLTLLMNDVFTNPYLKDIAVNKVFLELTGSETDFDKLQIRFIKPFLIEAYSVYKENESPDIKLIIDKLSFINKLISGERFQSVNYIEKVADYYEEYYKEGNKFLGGIQKFNDLIIL